MDVRYLYVAVNIIYDEPYIKCLSIIEKPKITKNLKN